MSYKIQELVSENNRLRKQNDDYYQEILRLRLILEKHAIDASMK